MFQQVLRWRDERWRDARLSTVHAKGSPMFISESRELAVLDQASQILEEARSLEDVKVIRDKAEAARTFIRAARLGLDLQNRAAELKLRAERKAGQFLASLKLRGGRRSKGHAVTLKLEDLGISRQQSKRWQAVASVSERRFLDYLQEANQQGREVTSAGLLRLARKSADLSELCRRACGVASRPASTKEVERSDFASCDIIDELKNHCHLLSDVLRPMYQDGMLEFKPAERRIVGRLLDEMRDLIWQLNRDRWRNADTHRSRINWLATAHPAARFSDA
jgi:hypothetical protein